MDLNDFLQEAITSPRIGINQKIKSYRKSPFHATMTNFSITGTKSSSTATTPKDLFTSKTPSKTQKTSPRFNNATELKTTKNKSNTKLTYLKGIYAPNKEFFVGKSLSR